MRASLDTNVIIHLYRADLQNMLFDFFEDGVFIYEQIRNIELENHGRDILKKVDVDIACEKIEIYTDERLKKQSVFKIFQINVKENRNLYGKGDLGEVLENINSAYLSGKNFAVFGKELTNYFQNLIVVKTCNSPDAILNQPKEIMDRYKLQADKISVDKLLAFMEKFSK